MQPRRPEPSLVSRHGGCDTNCFGFSRDARRPCQRIENVAKLFLGITICRPVALLKGPLTPLVGIKSVCHGPGYWCGAWCKASFSVRRVRTWTVRLVRAGNRRQCLLERRPHLDL